MVHLGQHNSLINQLIIHSSSLLWQLSNTCTPFYNILEIRTSNTVNITQTSVDLLSKGFKGFSFFQRKCWRYQLTKNSFKIILLKLLPHIPGVNELTRVVQLKNEGEPLLCRKIIEANELWKFLYKWETKPFAAWSYFSFIDSTGPVTIKLTP